MANRETSTRQTHGTSPKKLTPLTRNEKKALVGARADFLWALLGFKRRLSGDDLVNMRNVLAQTRTPEDVSKAVRELII